MRFLKIIVKNAENWQGRNKLVRLADGRRLRGRIFPEFTVFIPKTVNISPNLAFGWRENSFGRTKSFRGGGGAPKWL